MRKTRLLILASAMVLVVCGAAIGQTSIFTYQGKLTDGGAPANGSFEMRFRLFNGISNGIQFGETMDNIPVTAANGIFSVPLDFGQGVFINADDRFLEISVRHNSTENYVTLSPRQRVASSPFSIETIYAKAVLGQTPSNIPDKVVQRDDFGGFEAGTIVLATNRGGGGAKNSFGALWRDNQIVSWAKVTAAGTVSAGLGVTAISHTGIGSYRISTTASAVNDFSLIPFATAEVDTQPTSTDAVRIVSVNQAAVNQFDVFINKGSGAPVDNDFVFVVTGR